MGSEKLEKNFIKPWNQKHEDSLQIKSYDYWFKGIETLQQNWLLIESDAAGVAAYFISETSGVSNQISFGTIEEAVASLSAN